MQIIFDEADAMIVAKALAKSRSLKIKFEKPYAVDSEADKIYREALRVVAALRTEYGQ